MNTYKIDVAMDIRAYGYVEIEAESIDKAVELATPDFIKSNFESHGYGSDDFDYSSPRDIWIGDFECEETGESGFVEKDLPNSHVHNGLAHDAGPDMLVALRTMRAAYGRLHDFLSDAIEGGRLTDDHIPDDHAAICDALEKCNAADDVAKVAIGKAEGHTCPAAPSWPPCSPSPPRPHWPAMMKSRSRRVDCLLIFEIERDSNRLAQSAQNLKRSFPL